MIVHYLLFLCSLIIPVLGNTQTLSGSEIIEKSIKYHDPKGLLTSKQLEFIIKEERPNGSARQTSVTINTKKELINISSQRDGRLVGMTWDKGSSSFSLDGNKNYTAEEGEKFQLNKDRLAKMKDYYRYLWHLPTTLLDQGTVVHDEVRKADFFGQELLEVKVTYDAEVGADIWYFYFDPQSYALEGYRFYHNESANDGEYILLSEEATFASLRLPARREWHMHKDGKYLGADILIQIRK